MCECVCLCVCDERSESYVTRHSLLQCIILKNLKAHAGVLEYKRGGILNCFAKLENNPKVVIKIIAVSDNLA